MPPKKNQANGFYVYMLEQQNRMKAMTKRAPTMREMPGLCKQAWDSMSQAERAKYDTKAKQMRRANRGGGEDCRRDNQRQLISERKDWTKEMAKRRNEETNKMRSTWQGLDLLNIVFYVIDFQVMYSEWREEHRLPLEIGMVRFTMTEGIIDYFHEFINPGDPPQGNKHLAMEHSEATHQIPLNFDKGTTDFLGLWMQMEKFVCSDPRNADFPPIFCLSDQVLEIEYCLEYLHDRAQTGEPNRLSRRVYCLEDMIASLIKVGGRMQGEPSRTQLRDVLLQNRWDYTNNIRCDYHQEMDTPHCSLSIVRRRCFAVFDMLSTTLGFDLTNTHMPDETSVAFSVVHPSTFRSSRNDRAFQYQARAGGDFSGASSVRSSSPPASSDRPRYTDSTSRVMIPPPQGKSRTEQFTIALSDEENSDEDLSVVSDDDDDDEDDVKSTADKYELKQLRLPKTVSSAAAPGTVAMGRARPMAASESAQGGPAMPGGTTIIRGRGRYDASKVGGANQRPGPRSEGGVPPPTMPTPQQALPRGVGRGQGPSVGIGRGRGMTVAPPPGFASLPSNPPMAGLGGDGDLLGGASRQGYIPPTHPFYRAPQQQQQGGLQSAMEPNSGVPSWGRGAPIGLAGSRPPRGRGSVLGRGMYSGGGVGQ